MKEEHLSEEHNIDKKPNKRETISGYAWALIDKPVTYWRGKRSVA